MPSITHRFIHSNLQLVSIDAWIIQLVPREGTSLIKPGTRMILLLVNVNVHEARVGVEGLAQHACPTHRLRHALLSCGSADIARTVQGWSW